MATAKPLADQEALFCWFLHHLGSPQEAAVHAGVAPRRAQQQAAAWLSKPAVRGQLDRLKELERQDEAARAALRGLRRLAFAPSNDAVSLLFCGEEPSELPEDLDLFAVSEIRRPKGGGLDIKFFDRLKALELLLQHGGGKEASGAAELLAALAGAPCPGEGEGP